MGKKKLFYNDHPSEEPELNFDVFADELYTTAKEAVAESAGAFTVGIFGSWGSGKTTLMRCIERKFKEDPEGGYQTVWFNPWKYDDKEVVWSALIQTILRNIAQDTTEEEENKRKAALELAGRMVKSTTSIMWNTAKNIVKNSTGLDADTLKKELQLCFEGNNLEDDPYIFINKFEILFKIFVHEYIGDGKLVVFIDDLDRCLPENALTVLESLKLYFDQANCIFVLGIDKRVIEAAIKQRYKDTPGITTGKEYIEKIIQMNFFLPDKDEREVIALLQSEMTKAFANDEQMWSMILKATTANVRKTKQFIISFKLIMKLADRVGIVEQHMHLKLARLLLIQLNFPDFFDILKQDNLSNQNSFILKEFDDLCIAEETNNFSSLYQNYKRVHQFWENSLLKIFIQDSSEYAYIQSSKELKSLLRLVKFNAGSN